MDTIDSSIALLIDIQCKCVQKTVRILKNLNRCKKHLLEPYMVRPVMQE